jgi:hypothetical protein
MAAPAWPSRPRAAHGIPARQRRGLLARAQALLPLFAGRLRRLPAPDAMVVGFLVLAAVFPATWHLWAERRAGNANHLFAVALAFGFWQARTALSPASRRACSKQHVLKAMAELWPYPQPTLWQAHKHGAAAQVLLLVQLVSTARELEAAGGQGAARPTETEST